MDYSIAECGIIGGLALYPAECEESLNSLKPEDFTVAKAKALFELFLSGYSNGHFDIATVGAKIADAQLMDYLRECMTTFTTTTNYSYYIDAVKKNGRNTRLLNRIAGLQFDPPDDVGTELQAIIDGEPLPQKGLRIGSVVDKVKASLREPDIKNRIFTGLSKLDWTTGGLPQKMVSVIGAFPSTGKTTLLLNICQNQLKRNKKCVFFSLEMSEEQLLEKLLASLASVDYGKIRDRELTERELKEIDTALDALAYCKSIEIIDDVYTVEGMVEKIAEIKPDLVVCDYLQVIETAKSQENEKREVRYIMQTLKRAAKKHNCHIMIASQFVRTERSSSGGKAKVREATMFDLYGGAAVEQGADIIGMLSRPCVTDPEADPSITSFVIAKNKIGKIGRFDLYFNGEKQRFTEPDTRHQEAK